LFMWGQKGGVMGTWVKKEEAAEGVEYGKKRTKGKKRRATKKGGGPSKRKKVAAGEIWKMAIEKKKTFQDLLIT